MQAVVKLTIPFSYCYAECYYAECRYADCLGAGLALDDAEKNLKRLLFLLKL